MMINKELHIARQWKVNKIADDFTLWDVWEIPIDADNSKNENFQSFYSVVLGTFNKIQTSASLTSFLFALRFWLSKIFPLDKNINTLPIPGCNEISVKSRLNSHDLEKSKAGKVLTDNNNYLEFLPVYLFDNESLHEFSNDTVHGLIHVGWIKKNENHYNATLAIYVIPRGIFGKAYLKLIEPFRHNIVYPAMMKAIKAQWHEYLLKKN